MTFSPRIQVSLPQMMGQMLRFYGPMLLPCMVMMLIMVLAFQMRRWVHGCMYPPSCSYCMDAFHLLDEFFPCHLTSCSKTIYSMMSENIAWSLLLQVRGRRLLQVQPAGADGLC